MLAWRLGSYRAGLVERLLRVGERYADLSTRFPFRCSVVTAGTVLFSADVTCQTLTRKEGESHDWKRTMALTTWGAWHYGFPQKFLYLQLDRILGSGRAVEKMLIDVYINAPFFLLPTFYFATGMIRGEKTVPEIWAQLQREWFEASCGTALFWTPLVLANFKYVPQHSRILTITSLSFVHKTWLSWVANRSALAEKRGAAAAAAAVDRPEQLKDLAVSGSAAPPSRPPRNGAEPAEAPGAASMPSMVGNMLQPSAE
mmetsp:Transcript_102232/g.318429  ORF Transcript_102232/g.318429 Transcript_102232/m.318429 type:complete len:257 (-) Transcript_102232:69-839(-)